MTESDEQTITAIKICIILLFLVLYFGAWLFSDGKGSQPLTLFRRVLGVGLSSLTVQSVWEWVFEL